MSDIQPIVYAYQTQYNATAHTCYMVVCWRQNFHVCCNQLHVGWGNYQGNFVFDPSICSSYIGAAQVPGEIQEKVGPIPVPGNGFTPVVISADNNYTSYDPVPTVFPTDWVGGNPLANDYQLAASGFYSTLVGVLIPTLPVLALILAAYLGLRVFRIRLEASMGGGSSSGGGGGSAVSSGSGGASAAGGMVSTGGGTNVFVAAGGRVKAFSDVVKIARKGARR